MSHDCLKESEYECVHSFDDKTQVFLGKCLVCNNETLITRKMQTNNKFNFKDIVGPMEMDYRNDKFTKINGKVNYPVSIIYCNKIGQLERNKYLTPHNYRKKIESFQDYQEMMSKRPLENKVEWIENILCGTAEQQNILFQDQDFVFLPDIDWNKLDIKRLHCLAIVRDRTIKSLRDLTDQSIFLLEKIKSIGCQVLKNKYDIDENKLLIYFHYYPSYWHLHIHFTYLDTNQTLNGLTLRTHSLHDVIKNLRMDSSYYQKDIEILLS